LNETKSVAEEIGPHLHNPAATQALGYQRRQNRFRWCQHRAFITGTDKSMNIFHSRYHSAR